MFEEGIEPEDLRIGECFHGLPLHYLYPCGYCERGLVAVVVSGDDLIPEW